MNTLIHCPGQQVCVHMCLHRHLHTQTRNHHGTSHATTRRVLSAFPILIAIFRQFSNSIKNSFLCGTRYDTRSQRESTSQSFFKEKKKKEGLWVGHFSHSKGPVAGLEFWIAEVVCPADTVIQLQWRSWFLQLLSKLRIIAFQGDRILGWVDACTHRVRASHIPLTSGLGVGG